MVRKTLNAVATRASSSPLLASSRTGRQVLRPKLVATLAAAVGGYLLLSVASLAVACLRVPLPPVGRR